MNSERDAGVNDQRRGVKVKYNNKHNVGSVCKILGVINNMPFLS